MEHSNLSTLFSPCHLSSLLLSFTPFLSSPFQFSLHLLPLLSSFHTSDSSHGQKHVELRQANGRYGYWPRRQVTQKHGYHLILVYFEILFDSANYFFKNVIILILVVRLIIVVILIILICVFNINLLKTFLFTLYVHILIY